MPHSVVFVCLFYMPMCISACVSNVFQFHNFSILSAWSFQMVQLQIAIFCSWLSIRNSFQPWYYRPSKRMSSHAAITRSTHFMNRMKDRESVGLLHFVSVHTVFGCGCSCCTSIQMAAIWAQSHFNHLPTFFLSFFYLFIFCVCVHSVVLSGMHTHSTPHTHFETCSYAVSSRPICFYVHVSHKTVSNMGRMKRVRGSKGESEKKQYLKPDFFWQICYLSDFHGMSTYTAAIHTLTHIHICVGKCIYICFCEQQRKIVIYSTYFY